MDRVMLYSGGLDSFCLWQLQDRPVAIYLTINTRPMAREMAHLPRGIFLVDAPNLGPFEQGNGYVPYRNLYLLLRASLWAPIVTVAMIREWTPDKNRRFFNRIERLLTTMREPSHADGARVRILTPVAHLTKTQLVARFLRHVGSADELVRQTWSCYRAGDLHCGTCHGCVDRSVALLNNRIIGEPYIAGMAERKMARQARLVRRRAQRAEAIRHGQLGRARIYHALIGELQSDR